MSAPRLDIKINIYTYIIFLLLQTILPNLAYKEEKRLSSFKKRKKRRRRRRRRRWGRGRKLTKQQRNENRGREKIVSASRSLRRLEPKP